MTAPLSGAPQASPSQPAAPALPPARHGLGVVCGLAAGAWLGAAEAPARLAAGNYSPFAIGARIPRLEAHLTPAIVLFAISIAILAGAGWMLWKKTRFA